MHRARVSATFVLTWVMSQGVAMATARAQDAQTPAPGTTTVPATAATGAAPGTESPDDRAAATQAFQEGQRAYGAGDYRHAAESFEAAYKLKPHPSALWNAARARQRAGDIAKAANLFAKYLKDAPPSSKDRNTAQTALRQLSPKLGQLEIHAVGIDDIKVDREPIESTTLYVNPGAHVVEGKAGDHNVQQAQSVEAGQTESVALVVPTETTPPTPVITPTQTFPETQPPATTADHHGWSPAVVIVGGVLTAVAGGVTVAFGLITTNKANTWSTNQTNGNTSFLTQANRDDGSASEVRTNVALATTIGLAALTGAAALWLVDWKGRDRNVQVGASGDQMLLKGTF